MQHIKCASDLVKYLLLTCICILLANNSAYAQQVKKQFETDKIYLLNADSVVYDLYRTHDAMCLSGHVHFLHKGMNMWADSAVFYQESNSFESFGHIKVTQGDTLSLVGQFMRYDGGLQLLQVRDGVVLKHRHQVLKTDSLNYDRMMGCGYFFDGGELIDGSMHLTSDVGEYYVNGKDAKFYDRVKLQSPDYNVNTDTLFYNTITKWAEVFGPSEIYHQNDYITTTHALYNSELKKYRLYKNPYQSEIYRGVKMEHHKVLSYDVSLMADTIYYDQDSLMNAKGKIRYEDVKQRGILTGEIAHFQENLGKGYVTGNTLIRYYDQKGDTLFVHADSLHLYSFNLNTDSVYRKIHAYPHVRSYRQDMQSVCDSLVMNSQTKLMTLYKDPIVWSDNRQILGEEINVFLNDSTIDSIYVDRQCLMCEKIDSTSYNQVAAEQFRSYFTNGEMTKNVADKNVHLVYYPMDNNQKMDNSWYLETAKMILNLKNKKVDHIWAPASQGEGFPIDQCPHEYKYLENFAWFDYIRPLNERDIFIWREKNQEKKLKAQRRHEAPLQYLK